MKSTEYLYGKSPGELPPMDEGLIARINAINHNIAILEGNI